MGIAMRAKAVVKVPVRLLKKVLPPAAFERVYDVGYAGYRRAVRAGYAAAGAVRVLGNTEQREMIRSIRHVMPWTLVGIGGLEATWRLAKQMLDRGVPGDFVELGVARGGCAALMGGVLFRGGAAGEGRRLWLFDSFEGLPDPTAEDFRDGQSDTGDHVRPLVRGDCLGTLDEVKRLLLEQEGFPADRVRFVQGWFQDTVPVWREKIGSIAVLRIDGDWYESTKVCLEGLYDLVSPGGAVIVDDYASCYGCERAVHEFLDARGLSVDIRLDGRGGCWFLKPAGRASRTPVAAMA
ncbi:MAG TPA: TylF/MycF/NovP-related O-methyltransferase [Longimicrobium sp.]